MWSGVFVIKVIWPAPLWQNNLKRLHFFFIINHVGILKKKIKNPREPGGWRGTSPGQGCYRPPAAVSSRGRQVTRVEAPAASWEEDEEGRKKGRVWAPRNNSINPGIPGNEKKNRVHIIIIWKYVFSGEKKESISLTELQVNRCERAWISCIKQNENESDLIILTKPV